MFFLLAFKSLSKESLVLDEVSHEYVIPCASSLEVDVPAAKHVFLDIFASDKGVTATKQTVTGTKAEDLNLGLEEKGDYYRGKIDLASEPMTLTFKCPAESQTATIALRGTQNVTSDSSLYALIISAIILMALSMVIVFFQFCTFHHKKLD